MGACPSLCKQLTVGQGEHEQDSDCCCAGKCHSIRVCASSEVWQQRTSVKQAIDGRDRPSWKGFRVSGCALVLGIARRSISAVSGSRWASYTIWGAAPSQSALVAKFSVALLVPLPITHGFDRKPEPSTVRSRYSGGRTWPTLYLKAIDSQVPASTLGRSRLALGEGR